jgi:hypothetical protein
MIIERITSSSRHASPMLCKPFIGANCGGCHPDFRRAKPA